MIERYNPQSRYRQRSKQRFYSFLMMVIVFGFVAGVGYWVGGQSYLAQIKSQQRQITALEQDTETLRNELTEALTQMQEADMRYQSLQSEVEALVPSDGPMRGLVDLIKAQLAEGGNPERLTFLIQSARPPRNCSDPDTQRFVVATPTYKGPDAEISIDKGRVLISAEGQSAINSQGQAEAWFDVGKPLSVSFKKTDGQIETESGTLPIKTIVVVEDREYRFTLSEGAKSFVKVTYDSCDYP